MASLCEGGNEPPSSLKAISHLKTIYLDRDRTRNHGHRRPALYRLRHPGRLQFINKNALSLYRYTLCEQNELFGACRYGCYRNCIKSTWKRQKAHDIIPSSAGTVVIGTALKVRGSVRKSMILYLAVPRLNEMVIMPVKRVRGPAPKVTQHLLILGRGKTLEKPQPAHLNAIDLARDRTRNLGHRRPALYQLANQVDPVKDPVKDDQSEESTVSEK
ncbi:hypothetical protein ANN_01717 [Periplaneta americana]|uniref:60S ribosomal protein L6 n=1 Tax=Periplaneta americana TaxID=6978 RepID=A0ABQ8TUB1_PERAM|nr:hypothetical protein ANN_01717 [Periplaneta americana]